MRVAMDNFQGSRGGSLQSVAGMRWGGLASQPRILLALWSGSLERPSKRLEATKRPALTGTV